MMDVKPTVGMLRVANCFEAVAKSKNVPSINYRAARDAAFAELGLFASTEAYREFFVKWCDAWMARKAGRNG
jgi:hypothetical protein